MKTRLHRWLGAAALGGGLFFLSSGTASAEPDVNVSEATIDVDDVLGAPEPTIEIVDATLPVAAEVTTAALAATSGAPTSASVADAPADPPGGVSGTPVSPRAASTADGGTSAPVPYAVLLTAFAAVLLFAGGVAPRRVAAPLAPTFLPPVFPG